MRLSKADAARPAQLRRGFPLGGFAWFVGAAALFSATLGATASALAPYQVAAERRFDGILTARPGSTVVALPPGLPVARFLAQDGDSVSAGDVIAIQDLPAIDARINAVEARLRSLRLHRDCLIGLLRPDESLLMATVSGHEERQALRMALRSCALERASVRHAAAAAEAGRNRQAAELALVDQGVAAQAAGAEGGPGAGTAAMLARLAVSRSVLAARLREAEEHLALARVAAGQGLLGRVRSLSTEIAAFTSERDRLVAARGSPAVVAPSTGVLTGSSGSGDDGRDPRILGGRPAILTAEVLIPPQDLRMLDLGAPVMVTALMAAGGPSHLVGSVTSIGAQSSAGPSRVLVTITHGSLPLSVVGKATGAGTEATIIAEVSFQGRPVALTGLMSSHLRGLAYCDDIVAPSLRQTGPAPDHLRLTTSGF